MADSRVGRILAEPSGRVKGSTLVTEGHTSWREKRLVGLRKGTGHDAPRGCHRETGGASCGR